MLLTIKTKHQPASDLGFLLHKHPEKVQSFDINSGKAHVFYPEMASVALVLDINPIDMVRNDNNWHLANYVNDRPYTATSMMSHAIAQVFSTAMNGVCNKKPELLAIKMDFEVLLSVVKVNGGLPLIHKLFEPLGYQIEATQHHLDAEFTDWGKSSYFNLKLKNTLKISELLSHLYILLPVLEGNKHYYVEKDEIQKLFAKGEGWLAQHPEKELITKRYLKNISALTRVAFAQLAEEGETVAEEEIIDEKAKIVEERKISLHQLRLETVFDQLKKSGANKVLDLGCGEGKLLKMLIKERQFKKILGVDISYKSLQIAKEKLFLEDASQQKQDRIQLLQTALTYKDKRLHGFEAAALVEVIEHINLDRLEALEKVVFGFAKPKTVIVTTPNSEYNSKYEFLEKDKFRHSDHRFEWTRAEFEHWASKVCENFAYTVSFFPIGYIDSEVGASSQMGVFEIVV
ncbi:MAG: 3' terminal RNA ribose 2'-O-methyltransferase Hen1 [Bacteroidetes bacterium]|nr:MAG: 3' terminal RNA ribose 2'-O-methyltransferase Hen1 [Bacteroidota bacterium]